MSQKTREKSVKKHPLFEPQSGEFGGFSFLSASFLSEAGVVLIFGYFFIKKKVQSKIIPCHARHSDIAAGEGGIS
jgi:ABC-type cobalt transport system substrate-binding protein